MKTPLKTLLIASITLVGTLALAGCNTVDGVGQDLEAAGENLEEAAE